MRNGRAPGRRPAPATPLRRCPQGRALALALLVPIASSPAFAQVNWSGGNTPLHDEVVAAGGPVEFRYQVYDPGRTENPGRGAGLGASVHFRDADTGGTFAERPMTYAGQAGIGEHDDLFVALVPPEEFGSATRVEYYTVVYDSIAIPVWSETTRQDAEGNSPNFVFTFGAATMPNPCSISFSLCTNGLAAGMVWVCVHVQEGQGCWAWPLAHVAPRQLPDLWVGDLSLPPGIPQRLRYEYMINGRTETDAQGAPVERWLTLDPNAYLQGGETEGLRGAAPQCHLDETLAQPLRVHFSVCMGAGAYLGGICLSGSTPELGSFTGTVPLQPIQGAANPDLYEGDVTFPAGSPAVIQYKYKMDSCSVWEALYDSYNATTNRYVYLGEATGESWVAPTDVWANAQANTCPPATAVQRVPWTALKSLYR